MHKTNAIITKSMLAFSMLFLFAQTQLTAQQIPVKRSHAIAEPDPQLSLQAARPATGTLDVVAIMVEFQPDTSRLTSGTGIFGENGMEGLPYMANNADDITVEPLPHNRDYFEAHLEFAKNYYEKSSDGQLTIDYRVLPDIYRLPKKMEEYSPTGEEFTNEKVAELARDAWQQVEAQGGFDATGLDPENTAFVIFHAGVGRDIELTGTSLDITPLDIPSLYLRKNSLGNLLDEPAFNGFSMNNGNFRVTNSMIIPRTESRRGLDIQENEFVFPLSINGLLVASIGSHLGLPDLFNTETGNPGIGRFGLMDGAGFFSYNGLLPPEPSAWEKVFLGWETPFTISANEADSIELPAGSLSEPNSIAKYELSNSEYFLIENRHRDPDGTGITITIRQPDGRDVQQTFTNQDEAFVFQEADFDTLLEAGTFVDASNFDFSLPGGLDTGEDEDDPADDRELNGGILIWHIDNAIISSQLQNDAVNTNPNRRGVDLEEADGAQDIGPGLSGALDNSAAFGTAFDFWWSGNNYTVILENGQEISFYENRFGPDTNPDNSSNSGAPSFFELYDFSDNRPTASFKIRPVQQQNLYYEPLFSQHISDLQFYTPQDDYWDYFPLSLTMYETNADTFLVAPGNAGVLFFDHLNPETPNYRLNTSLTNQQPFSGSHLVLATNPQQGDSDEITLNALQADAQGNLTTAWTATAPANSAFISSQNGDTLFADFTDAAWLLDSGNSVSSGTSFDFRSAKSGNTYAAIAGNTVSFPGTGVPQYLSSANNRLYAGVLKSADNPYFYIFEDEEFTLVNPAHDQPFISIFDEEKAEWPAISQRLEIYRVNKEQNVLEGYNKLGGMLDNTPISAPDGVQFTGTPLLADITGDNQQDVLVLGYDDVSMNIYAYETNGEPIQGFPLYIGEIRDHNTGAIHPIFYENKLYAVSHFGDLRGWEFPEFTSADWPGRYGPHSFNKVSGSLSAESGGEQDFTVLNTDETYNWPNPASDFTHIRFEVAPPGGSVEISIINVSGRIIHEQTVDTRGGAPEEIRINTQSWGSGGYIARVKANVGGKTESKLIKIGVIH